jgi:hypothetical protein
MHREHMTTDEILLFLQHAIERVHTDSDAVWLLRVAQLRVKRWRPFAESVKAIYRGMTQTSGVT